ncbi:hypothetical protein LSH36_1g03000 [Paralvinella palmiformis]|uniref:Beta-1,4-glucuronyltransferase 1 n=1 Tax=Paralvinella palmiformis TaxID=53620 RepID=A0AAD9NKM7_9ANNE|nr:hypothetical protein LSH36_1g03000 [Paralvinella palmiformis]
MMSPRTPWLRLTWSQVVVMLGFALAFLQLFHMLLLNRLEARNSSMRQTEAPYYLKKDTQTVYPIIEHAIKSSRIMDASGQYNIIYDVMQSSAFSTNDTGLMMKQYGVTLVTHCSVNHIHHLIQLSHHWQGPVSVAIFIPQEYSSTVVQSLLVLHYCMPHLRKNISIHLVYPMTQSPLSVQFPSFVPEISRCRDFHEVLDTVLQQQFRPMQNYAFEGQSYPNNLLRNVAARFLPTDYLLVIDIDIIPSPNLFLSFVDFARRTSFATETGSLDAQVVYVVPVFELQRGVELPQDKSSLLQLWKQGLVRPFYYDLCWKCQRPTDYDTWRNLTSSADLHNQYEVVWKDPWEPFYIGSKYSLPRYDERFKQYGFNRISQVCETHIAGFRFAVLDNAFLVHLGFKTQEGYHQGKEMEQELNRQLFRKFKEELKIKYPESARRCY